MLFPIDDRYDDPVEDAPDVFEDEDWIPLPEGFDIHHWQIMRDFCETREGDERATLLDAVHGNGAFRLFRAAVERLGIEENWYGYRNDVLRRRAMEWLDEQNIDHE